MKWILIISHALWCPPTDAVRFHARAYQNAWKRTRYSVAGNYRLHQNS